MTTPGPTQDMVQTLVGICAADPVLSAAEVGGPSLTRADETRTVPYIVIGVTRGGKIDRYLDGGSVQAFAVSVSVVAASAEQAAQLSDRAQAIFDDATFACAAGVCLYALVSGAAAVRQVKHLAGEPLYEVQVGLTMEYYFGPAS